MTTKPKHPNRELDQIKTQNYKSKSENQISERLTKTNLSISQTLDLKTSQKLIRDDSQF